MILKRMMENEKMKGRLILDTMLNTRDLDPSDSVLTAQHLDLHGQVLSTTTMMLLGRLLTTLALFQHCSLNTKTRSPSSGK